MAKWLVYQRSNGSIGFVYANAYTREAEMLGEMRGDTPDAMIVRWVIDTEKWKPGDVLQLASGRQLFFLDEVGVA